MNIQVQWVPAHCTLEDFEAKGLPATMWHGNDLADKAAKQVLLDAMDQVHCPTDTTGKQLLHTAAKIQKATLSLRPRRLNGWAIKLRKRRAPDEPKEHHAGKRRCEGLALNDPVKLLTRGAGHHCTEEQLWSMTSSPEAVQPGLK